MSALRRFVGQILMTRTTRISVRRAASVTTENREWISTAARLGDHSKDERYPLTEEEAFTFVTSKLKISDPQTLIAKNRMTFLNHVAKRMKEETPFANFYFFLSPPAWEMDEHHYKNWMLSGKGGNCWVINTFMKALLECFDYKAHHVCGHTRGDDYWDAHISTIVEDVAYPGSRHLVEPGHRLHISSPVSLDFVAESPEHRFHHKTLKFFKEGDELIACTQTATAEHRDEGIMYDSRGTPWRRQITYHLRERRNGPAYLRCGLKLFRTMEMAGKPLRPPFNGLVLLAYLTKEMAAISVLAYQDQIDVRRFYEDGRVERSEMNKSDLLAFLMEQFPQYSEKEYLEVFKRCLTH